MKKKDKDKDADKSKGDGPELAEKFPANGAMNGKSTE